MVVTILDFGKGKTTVITDFPASKDVEEFVSAFYGLDNVEWMTTVKAEINITTLDNLDLDC